MAAPDGLDRLPPHNLEAEQSLLGSLLLDRDAITRVASFLRPADFYREAHALIYEGIAELHERREPADLVTLADELERRDLLEPVGGVAYLTSLLNSVPTAAHVEHYGHIVERDAILRRLIEAAGQIAGLAFEGAEEIDEVVDKAEQVLFDVSQRRLTKEMQPIGDVVSRLLDQVEYLHQHPGALNAVPTGFIDLDKMLGGLQPSDLVILAGRPSLGKTSLALTIAHHAARKLKQCVAIFALEMSAEQLAQRMLSAETGIDSHRIRLGDLRDAEWPLLTRGASQLSDLRVFIDDTPSISPTEVRIKARRLHAEERIDLIILDYVQLMATSGRIENRVQEISLISRQLKALARELSVPVLALSQLSRAVEQRQDKHPVLSDLRESGGLEQDADVVMFIYRDEVYYNEDDWKHSHPGEPYPEGIAEIMVAKHRSGPTGRVHLLFRKNTTQFVDLALHPHGNGAGQIPF